MARKAAPPVYNYVRGNKKRALDVAACDEEMQKAMANYLDDWRSAGDTSEDYWRSWQQLHTAHWDGWRRPAAAVLPLDALKIHIVGALLKVGGIVLHITTWGLQRPSMWSWASHGDQSWI